MPLPKNRNKLEGLVLSHTQLDLFGRCPQRWYRRYVLKEPDVIGAPLIMGRAFHTAIEANFRYRFEHEVDLEAKEVAKIFRDSFDEEADKPVFKDLEDLSEAKVDWQGENPKELRKLGERALLRYHKKHAPFLEPALIEQWYEEEVKPGVWLVGAIDLVTTKGTVVDYKLVNYAWKEDRTEMSMQPTCYALLRGGPTAFDYHFVTKNPGGVGISIRRTKRNQSDIDWLKDVHIPRVAQDMKELREMAPAEAEYFARRIPGQQCWTCPHRKGCGYRR